MAVRIRLRRMGAKKKPFYRVVVASMPQPKSTWHSIGLSHCRYIIRLMIISSLPSSSAHLPFSPSSAIGCQKRMTDSLPVHTLVWHTTILPLMEITAIRTIAVKLLPLAAA